MSSRPEESDAHAILAQEITNVKQKISESFNIISNNQPFELQQLASGDAVMKSLCYIDGLRANLEATESQVPTANNLLTSQFLCEMNEKIGQVEELVAFKRGLILDLDTEITRLKTQISIAQEAKSSQKPEKKEVKPEHIQKAKQKFHVLKTELHGLINSLFPNVAEDMIETLAQLMQERMSESSSGYVEVTSEKFHLMELLKDMGIVTKHPYNNKTVKLAF